MSRLFIYPTETIHFGWCCDGRCEQCVGVMVSTMIVNHDIRKVVRVCACKCHKPEVVE